MAYVYDEDLEFLGECSDEQLEKLAHIIIYDDDKKTRIAEEITKSNEYKRYGTKYSKYWEIIAGDFQKFGGHTIVNVIRFGKGVQYNEILNDILGSNFSKLSIFEKEKELLKNAILIILEKLEIDERIKIAKYIKFQGKNYNPDTIFNYIQENINDIDFDYKITKIILEYITTKRIDYSLAGAMSVNSITKTKVASTGVLLATRTFIAPVAALTTLNLPLTEAKRVTIPASIVIACLRKILKYEKLETRGN